MEVKAWVKENQMPEFVILEGSKGLAWRNAGQWIPQQSIVLYAEADGHGVTIWPAQDEAAFSAVLGAARLEMALWNSETLRKEDVSLFVLATFEFGQRAMHRLAAFGRGVELVEALVEAGADINAVDKRGMTPLDCIFANSEWPDDYRPSQDGGEHYLAELFRQLGAKTALELG
jgi:hypothetical protein